MPNHVHLIIVIWPPCTGTDFQKNNQFRTSTARRAPTSERFGKPTKYSIPTIIRSLKSAAMGIRLGKPQWSTYWWQTNILVEIPEWIWMINHWLYWAHSLAPLQRFFRFPLSVFASDSETSEERRDLPRPERRSLFPLHLKKNFINKSDKMMVNG